MTAPAKRGHAMTTSMPIYDQLVAEFGPLFPEVDTDFVLLASQAVLAMAERAP